MSWALNASAISVASLPSKSNESASVALVVLRPDLAIAEGVDQLDIDRDLILVPPHASLEDIGHAQRFADFLDVARSDVAILHHAGAADHGERLDFRQVGQEIVLDAVGEKRVFLVVAVIFEGQNSDAFLRNIGVALRLAGGGEAEKKQKPDRHGKNADDDEIEFAASLPANRFFGREIIGFHDPLGRDFEGPGECEGDRETDNKDDND